MGNAAAAASAAHAPLGSGTNIPCAPWHSMEARPQHSASRRLFAPDEGHGHARGHSHERYADSPVRRALDFSAIDAEDHSVATRGTAVDGLPQLHMNTVIEHLL